jgi:hypothetical protein
MERCRAERVLVPAGHDVGRNCEPGQETLKAPASLAYASHHEGAGGMELARVHRPGRWACLRRMRRSRRLPRTRGSPSRRGRHPGASHGCRRSVAGWQGEVIRLRVVDRSARSRPGWVSAVFISRLLARSLTRMRAWDETGWLHPPTGEAGTLMELPSTAPRDSQTTPGQPKCPGCFRRRPLARLR